MMAKAVEDPGDAPSRAAMLPSAELTISVPNSSTPPFLIIFLDNLHPLSGNFRFPVLHLGIQEVFAEREQPVFGRLHHLLDQVFGQRNIMQTGHQHRSQVAHLQRFRQVEVGAVFKELG